VDVNQTEMIVACGLFRILYIMCDVMLFCMCSCYFYVRILFNYQLSFLL